MLNDKSRSVFISVSTSVGTLSGLVDLPGSTLASEVLDLKRALEEAADEVVSDWLVTVTGEHDAS